MQSGTRSRREGCWAEMRADSRHREVLTYSAIMTVGDGQSKEQSKGYGASVFAEKWELEEGEIHVGPHSDVTRRRASAFALDGVVTEGMGRVPRCQSICLRERSKRGLGT